MDNATTPASPLKASPQGRVFFALVLLLSLVGFGVSVELTNIHHATHTDPNFESVCAVSDEVNCETVARSPYSVFLGAPVSVWGLIGYFILAGFAVWGLKGSRLHDRFAVGIVSVLVVAAMAAAGFLAFVSFTRIDSLCLFCMTLYGINSVLLVVVATFLIYRKINPFRAIWADIRALCGKPLLFGGIALPVLGVVAGVMFGIEPYWQHVGWRDMDRLPTGVDKNGFHWIGAEKPILTIVEYSDYQCPFCRKAHQDLRILAAEFPDEVRIIHRHLPLDQACNDELDRPFHEFACEFAKAAECAGEQKMFWAMNDALFSVQETMKAADVDVELLAVELGIDRSTFSACMARDELPEGIKRDLAAAAKLAIQGTPTFYIGIQAYEGRVPESTVRKLVEKARKKQERAGTRNE